VAFNIEQRVSDSPLVEAIWRKRSDEGGWFTSIAASHWELVVTRRQGKTTLTVRGPESKATLAYCPPGAEHFGIYFKLGVFMPQLPAANLLDTGVELPGAAGRSFWLASSLWQFPDFDNAETFVDRLVRAELIVREPIVDGVLHHQPQDLSLRHVQRRFLRATGLTHGAVHQIQRARHATLLLQSGVSILDTADLAGYADQSHLTRSLKRYVGKTPGQLLSGGEQARQMSFLFKT
jgi:hypothetical protein